MGDDLLTFQTVKILNFLKNLAKNADSLGIISGGYRKGMQLLYREILARY